MGSGKSTVGRKLSSATGLNFIDLDNYIRKKEDKTINEIFDEEGEDYFRQTESRLLKEIIENDSFILSCGGGTPCFFDNMSLMNKNGITIYLKMTVDAIYSRLLNSPDNRPLLKKIPVNKLRSYIENTLKEREKYYKMAKHTVEAINLKTSFVVKLLG
ncbi:MAG: shikimate kinase [Bacteroidales bacterium]|nr:shikimate kinase [Bacteroidales bacterium]